MLTVYPPPPHHPSQAAMSWIMFYYVFLKPLKLLPSDEKMNEKYDDADLHPRFSFFSVSVFACFFRSCVL